MRSPFRRKPAPPPAAPEAPPPPAPGAESGGPLLLSWFSAPGSPEKLRARYRPAGRFSHLAFSVAPWFDVLLLLAAFLGFHRAVALVPAETVALPRAEFAAGARSSLVLVVRALPPARAGRPVSAEAFLDGVAWNLASPERAAAFRDALAAAARAAAETNVLVYMDEALPHGDAVRLAGLFREAGLDTASFVTQQ